MTNRSRQVRVRFLIACVVLGVHVTAAAAQTGDEAVFERAALVFAQRVEQYALGERTVHDQCIFAPPVGEYFHQRVREALTLHERILLEGANAWLEELPPVLLQHLPPLPPGIEYRLIHAALVLWDAHAEIVIDGLPGALR